MSNLEGKVAIVTGSSRGIGRAIAKELAAHGAKLVLNYHTSAEMAQSLLDELTAAGTKAINVQADVSNPNDCKKLADAASGAFGQIDVLINNAGINRDRTIQRMSVEEWQAVINTNLNSVFYMTNLVIPGMRERNYGRIINIASIIGQMGNFGQGNYGAAKGGIIAFTKTAAQELARYNITVNAICPGFIETDMLAGVSDEVRQALLARIPLGRFGTPEEIAAFVRFLLIEGDWVTGQQLNPNGGMYM